jgi:hypothetical protein
MTKVGIFSSAAIAALLGAMAVTTVANGAATPSSPAERATTAELNRKTLADRAVADARERQLQAQHEEQLKQQKSQFEEKKRIGGKQLLPELKNAEGNP